MKEGEVVFAQTFATEMEEGGKGDLSRRTAHTSLGFTRSTAQTGSK